MHVLQPKHLKVKREEAEKLLDELNISRAQLPKIKQEDPAIPEGCEVGDMIKIERKFGEKTVMYYRVVV
jgi:DNA-directed RNA polymerase subunit H (RpoH/RPB5)